ncbi:MAG: hypothetical protein J6P07_06760 [Spirochaetaceae bacterium]|nr:hypothetical protein [Spirochaetaceae bacterium]MBO7731522.1 hypothetical protein [Methanobrevibacter sp.]
MDIDKDLVARAFSKAGEEPITQDEWSEGTSNRVRVVKDFYLATILEALSSYDWTSQKKRARLVLFDDIEDEESENLTKFSFMYELPADCAKAIALSDNKDFIVEGGFIYTDSENAVLLYVRNYFTGTYDFEAVETPVIDDIDKYYTKDESGHYEKAETYTEGTAYFVIIDHDYNFYDQPSFDPSLSAYIECKLAASIVLKLTGDKDKYQLLFNEAQLIANNAQKKSAENARNRTKGNEWWINHLGLE